MRRAVYFKSKSEQLESQLLHKYESLKSPVGFAYMQLSSLLSPTNATSQERKTAAMNRIYGKLENSKNAFCTLAKELQNENGVSDKFREQLLGSIYGKDSAGGHYMGQIEYISKMQERCELFVKNISVARAVDTADSPLPIAAGVGL